MSRVAIIAAMAGELKPLVAGWTVEEHHGVTVYRWRHPHGEWLAACAGAGAAAATKAFAAIEATGRVDRVLSIGWAGALREEMEPGKAYTVGAVIEARTVERFDVEGRYGQPWLLTATQVVPHQQKQHMGQSYKSALVDMEAATVARLALMRGIPFDCIKAVSDGVGDRLPDFNRFIDAKGRFQTTRFALRAILTPWYWLPLVRMGENSKVAAKALAGLVLETLDPRGELRKRNAERR